MSIYLLLGSEVNRKMIYLSHFMENGLHGLRLSTLFTNQASNVTIDFDLIRKVRDPSTYTVPFDQGVFDLYQNWLTIMMTMAGVSAALAPPRPHSVCGFPSRVGYNVGLLIFILFVIFATSSLRFIRYLIDTYTAISYEVASKHI
jgi:hypothetical protein